MAKRMRLYKNPKTGGVVIRFDPPSLILPVANCLTLRRMDGVFVNDIYFGYIYEPNSWRDEACPACVAGHCVKKVISRGPGNEPNNELLGIQHDKAHELN